MYTRPSLAPLARAVFVLGQRELRLFQRPAEAASGPSNLLTPWRNRACVARHKARASPRSVPRPGCNDAMLILDSAAWRFEIDLSHEVASSAGAGRQNDPELAENIHMGWLDIDLEIFRPGGA